MQPFDYNKYRKNNPLLKEAKGDMEMEESFSNRIKKKSQRPGMEESFTDRINASADKKKQVTDPAIAKLLPSIQKECGNEFEAVTQKDSKGGDLIFVIPNNIPPSNYYNGAIGAVVVPQSNGTVTIGMAKDSTNDDVFFSKKDSKIFNSNDTESILDHIAMILSKVEQEDFSMKEGIDNAGGIETELMATIKGQNDDMSFLDGVTDEEFVAALKNLGMKFKTSDSGMSMDYYIGRPGNGMMFSNEDGNWFAGDWARP